MESLEAAADICVDTDILVDYLRKRDPGSTAYKKWKSKAKLSITSVSVFELLLGVHLSSRKNERMAEVESLLEHHAILPFDRGAATVAAQVGSGLRSEGAGIEIRDLFNGAICSSRTIPILTRNLTHYARIPKLSVISS